MHHNMVTRGEREVHCEIDKEISLEPYMRVTPIACVDTEEKNENITIPYQGRKAIIDAQWGISESLKLSSQTDKNCLKEKKED